MNQDEIKKILPHRDQMLLIDEVTKVEDKAIGKYHVRGDEWFLKGHFPDNPIVPGVILCEILAQSACILIAEGISGNITPMYTGLNNVRFKHPVHPGDTIMTECKIVKSRPPFYFAEGKGTVNDELCIKAEFSFAVVGE